MDTKRLYSILLEDKPSDILRFNEQGLFELIPELKECKGFNQKNEWHIYDVYEHILHVVDNVSPNLVIRLAALFHDIGKPLSYTEDENGVGHFKGHWESSQRIFNSFSNKYNIDKKISSRVSNLIWYHDINIRKLNDNDLVIMYKHLGIDGIIQLYELKKADLLSQNPKYHYILDDYTIQKKKVLSRFKNETYTE